MKKSRGISSDVLRGGRIVGLRKHRAVALAQGCSQVFRLWYPQQWWYKKINKSSELGTLFFLLLQFFQVKSSSFSLARRQLEHETCWIPDEP